jgi:hypothetical protein
MPIAQDARKKPLSIKVHVSTGEGVEITWTDHHASRYDFPYLRDHCPCALCNDEREKKSKGGAASSSPLLPMYKPRDRNFQLRAPARNLPLRRLRARISLRSKGNHRVTG